MQVLLFNVILVSLNILETGELLFSTSIVEKPRRTTGLTRRCFMIAASGVRSFVFWLLCWLIDVLNAILFVLVLRDC
jgi:hypothetical protein